MKNRLNTTSLREIKDSFKRFLSLVVMSMLGVLVFVGLKQSSPDMLKSLDTYYDNDNHYDIKVVSTLGLKDSDYDALNKIKGVKQVEKAYSKDVLITVNNDESVIKIIGITNNINKVKALKGRNPRQNNEIIVEQNMLDKQNLKIGDTITIDDEDFKEKELTIVGVVKSSVYISSTTGALNRGNTNIGSGHVSYYVYGLSSNFNMDYYTEMYITIDGAKKLITDSNEYNTLVNNTLSNVDKIKKLRAQARYDETYNEINNEIEKEEKEGRDKLDNAKESLDNANNTLTNTKGELKDVALKLDDAKSELDQTKAKLDDTKEELDQYNNELNNSKEMIETSKNQINEKLSNFGFSYDDIIKIIDVIDNYELTKNDVISLISISDVSTINALSSIYDYGLIDLVKLYLEKVITKEELISQIPMDIACYDDVINFINNNQIDVIINDIVNVSSINTMIGSVPQTTDHYVEIMMFLNWYKQDISGYVDFVGALKKINNAQNAYDYGINKYNNALSEYNNGLKAYRSYSDEYTNNLKTYNDGLNTYNTSLNLYNKNVSEYNGQVRIFDEKISETKEKLDEIPESKWYVYSRPDDSEYTSFIDDGKSVTNLAKLFPTIFYIVAILISLISMSRMVEDDRSEVGTLKSLGFNNRHIMKKYLIYSGIATLIGGVLGALLGFFFLLYIIWNIYKILFDVPVFEYDYNPINSIIGISLALIAICGTTILTIRKVVKEKPSELMRPKAPSNGKRVLLEKIPFIWNHINFSNKITIRNLFRYKKRVFMMVFGILGCTALLLAGFGIRDSIVTIPDKQYNGVFHFDDMIYLNNVDTNKVDDVLNNKYIKNRLDVMMSSSYEAGNNNINLMAVEHEDNIKNILELNELGTKKELSLKNNEVIISDKISSLMKVKKGDKIAIKGPNNEVYDFKISGVFENYASHYVIMNKYTYEKYIDSYKINVSYVNLKNQKEENTAIKSFMKNEDVISVMSIKTTIKSVDNMLKSLNSVVLILIVLSGSLSFVILYNLSYINISERKRELATLKVLGFTDKEVDNYIVKETIILTILGIVLGLLFGIVLNDIIIDTIEISQVRFLHLINTGSFVITAMFIMGFTVIVNVITHFALKKIDMIESLKSVE